MFLNALNKFFGSRDERLLKKLDPILAQVNGFESSLETLSDAALKEKTIEFKKRLKAGSSLEDILPEAFAVVREASKRVLEMRPYDVQILGAIILHRGMVAEMATGEGKTLVATLPVYLNALSEKGVHVVTVNDYLAERDSHSMGHLYKFLGLTVDCVINDMNDEQRQAAYGCDVIYATNNELGFDYLRDNMKFRKEEVAQRPLAYAIVDEVDSILIDEARTPLIISGPTEDSSETYMDVDKIIPLLKPEDYEMEEKNKSITLTEEGNQHVEDLLEKHGLIKEGSLYEIQNIALVHHINQALRAHLMFRKDVDYIVKDDQVIIIDEFTGRMMDGRRYSDGLHQALEAKEHVAIQMENQTLASITFQNYFRLYDKLSGMTGTAKTEAAELHDIYNLDVVQIRTKLPVVRKDNDDEVYRTEREKMDAIVKQVKECQERNQPVLVGTASIEKSELISSHLTKNKIKHNILNARFHEQEAGIIEDAGRPGNITIATNMAGRGTDIKLGGNLEARLEQELDGAKDKKDLEKKIRTEIKEAAEVVKKAGGLCVIGTERHESRRVDNQLRGRSGRQGDPGMSRFYLSLEDDLMRIFGSDRLDSMLQKLGLEEGEAITHPWVNKALENAQRKVEARNYDMRKQLLKYDDVMNAQRKVVYEQRRNLMEKHDSSALVEEMRQEALDNLINRCIPENSFADQWNIETLHEEVLRLYGIDLPLKSWSQEDGIAEKELRGRIESSYKKHMLEKENKYSAALMRMGEKSILLRVLDSAWKDHLHNLDHLRQGINLRAIAQRDPLNEYKQEAFIMFEDMMTSICETTISTMSHLEISTQNEDELEAAALDGMGTDTSELDYSGPQKTATDMSKKPGGPQSIAQRLARSNPSKKVKKGPNNLTDSNGKTPRNALCPCGSEKRFKHCCGKSN